MKKNKRITALLALLLAAAMLLAAAACAGTDRDDEDEDEKHADAELCVTESELKTDIMRFDGCFAEYGLEIDEMNVLSCTEKHGVQTVKAAVKASGAGKTLEAKYSMEYKLSDGEWVLGNCSVLESKMNADSQPVGPDATEAAPEITSAPAPTEEPIVIPELSPEEAAQAVVFNDHEFEQAFRRTYGYEGEITRGDLWYFTELKLLGFGLRDISDLQYFENLRVLDLGADDSTMRNNVVKDISVLPRLTHLKTLILNYSFITDFSPLAELKELEELRLIYANLTDIEFLRPMTSLKVLYIDANEITDIGPLAGLTALEELYIDYNQITDISPLSGLTELKYLNIGNNAQMGDLSPLLNLKKLYELKAMSMDLADISVLKQMTWLKVLWVTYNPLSSEQKEELYLTLSDTKVYS